MGPKMNLNWLPAIGRNMIPSSYVHDDIKVLEHDDQRDSAIKIL